VVAAGANPVSLRTGIIHASARLAQQVKKLSQPVKSNADLLRWVSYLHLFWNFFFTFNIFSLFFFHSIKKYDHSIATIASGSPSMGAIIAKAYEKIGDTGSTVVEESQTLLDEIGELFIMCFVYLAFFIFVFFFLFVIQSLMRVYRLIEAFYLLTL
jgi:chaperonin GroEL